MPTNLLTGQVYPFDPTGKLASNKITNEFHNITAANWRSYHFIVPKKGPFFENSLVMTYRDTSGVIRPLRKGVDWVPSYWFIGASRSTAYDIYGGITFLNASLAGNVTITYQTIGGEWVLDADAIAEILANYLNNPLTTSWEVIANVPRLFPPVAHEWNLVDMVGAREMTEAIHEISEYYRTQSTAGIAEHVANKANPHSVTKAQVGLSRVLNYGLTPLTSISTATGNDTYVTPASARLLIQDEVKDEYIAFTQRKNNPHSVTAAQVGAYTKAQVDALLTDKLATSGIAFDSHRLAGRNYQELVSEILTGTAANAGMLAGRTLDQVVEYVKNEVSQSETFGGFNVQQLHDWILEGTAANANTFGGKTEQEFITYLNNSGLVNANSLQGRNTDQLKTFILEGTAANASRLNGKTYQEIIDDISTSASNDAQTLRGKTLDDIISEARDGTVNNANLAFGYNMEELKALFLKGKADDSKLFDGKTLDEVKTTILAGTAADAETLEGSTKDQIIAAAVQQVQQQSGNATTFGGMTVEEYRNDILQRTINNAENLGGQSPAQIKKEIRDELAENSVQQYRFMPYVSGNTGDYVYYNVMNVDFSTVDASTAGTVRFLINGYGTRENGNEPIYFAEVGLDLGLLKTNNDPGSNNRGINVIAYGPVVTSSNDTIVTNAKEHLRFLSYYDSNENITKIYFGFKIPTVAISLALVGSVAQGVVYPDENEVTFPHPTGQEPSSAQVVLHSFAYLSIDSSNTVATQLSSINSQLTSTTSKANANEQSLNTLKTDYQNLINTTLPNYAASSLVNTINSSLATLTSKVNGAQAGENITVIDNNELSVNFTANFTEVRLSNTGGVCNFTATNLITPDLNVNAPVARFTYFIVNTSNLVSDPVINWGTNVKFTGDLPIIRAGKRYLISGVAIFTNRATTTENLDAYFVLNFLGEI